MLKFLGVGIVSVCIGGLVTLFWSTLQGIPTVGNFLGYLIIPAYMAGALWSGNLHSPDDWILYGGIWVEFSIITFLLLSVGLIFAGISSRSKPPIEPPLGS